MTRWVRSLCPYCGVGCGILAAVEDGRVSRIKGDPAHPANFGEVCAKAVFLPHALRTADRATHPLMARRRGAPLERTDWATALARAARAIRDTWQRHGPDAIAVYGSGQLLTEEYYVWVKLLRGVLGTNNFDSNSRLCMAAAAAAYTAVFGADGPPTAYADIELADCVFLIGTNTADCHPIVFRRIEKAKRARPELRILVADPRRTETADLADLYLPVRPGSDVALLNAMLHVCLAEGLVDRPFVEAHTTGFDQVAAAAARWTPARAAELCGVPAAAIVAAARTFGRARAALSFWSMGLNQSAHGVAKNAALLNLHLATGQVARPGAGPFSLTGQPNAMGGRMVGGLAHLLPGFRQVARAADRAAVAAAWGIPAEHLSARPGLAAVELFEAAAEGRVRVLWVICTNPAVSMPELDLVERALRQVDLLVVQDAYHPTETSRYADIVLPAAQWGEKEGTMVNSERRITYLPKLVEPPGEALPDWTIGVQLARALGAGRAFPFESAEAVFEEFKALTRGTPADITGVSYARLRHEGPLQWPCPAADAGEPAHPGTPRLYQGGRFPTPDGRARFVVAEPSPPYEPPSSAYPLVLTTGRLKHQWHTMTRTGKVEALLKGAREPFLELNPADAARLGVRDADFVEVASRRGKAVVQVRVTDGVAPGSCFMPFHWGRQGGHYKAANNLTVRAVDPVSRQPELKLCAVRVRPVSADA
ncbi:MAG TPA: nitrate reductase [Thermodesulfobacteriota bacterium]|nr:nitrate reductase [Thermodesulfobacteriota bacterium]